MVKIVGSISDDTCYSETGGPISDAIIGFSLSDARWGSCMTSQGRLSI